MRKIHNLIGRLGLVGLGCLLVLSLTAVGKADEVSDAFALGDGAFHQGRYEEALLRYRDALAIHGPHLARAHFNLGVCHYRLKRRQAAIGEYREAIKLRTGRYAAASYALGIALQESGERREALVALTQAAEASGGSHAGALFELALDAQRNEDFTAAGKFYRRAIIQSKDQLPACHNNLGVMHAARGEIDEAMREFELALARTKGKFTEARENLAHCRALIDRSGKTMIARLKTVEGTAAGYRVTTDWTSRSME